MQIDPKEGLVAFIVAKAAEYGLVLTTLRVIKFVYLADVYSYQVDRRPLTDWKWKFHHFGPYTTEYFDAVSLAEGHGLIRLENKQSKYSEDDYQLYRPGGEDPQNLDSFVPASVRGRLEQAIVKWGNDSHALLDYVYFKTEPMLGVKPGDGLQFDRITPWADLMTKQPPRIKKSRLAKLREAIQKVPAPTGTLAPFSLEPLTGPGLDIVVTSLRLGD